MLKNLATVEETQFTFALMYPACLNECVSVHLRCSILSLLLPIKPLHREGNYLNRIYDTVFCKVKNNLSIRERLLTPVFWPGEFHRLSITELNVNYL